MVEQAGGLFKRRKGDDQLYRDFLRFFRTSAIHYNCYGPISAGVPYAQREVWTATGLQGHVPGKILPPPPRVSVDYPTRNNKYMIVIFSYIFWQPQLTLRHVNALIQKRKHLDWHHECNAWEWSRGHTGQWLKPQPLEYDCLDLNAAY